MEVSGSRSGEDNPATYSGTSWEEALYGGSAKDSQPTWINDWSSLCRPSIIIMVGLPARGKSYIAQKLLRYLNWTGIKTKLVNVGSIRRAYRNSEPPKDPEISAVADARSGRSGSPPLLLDLKQLTQKEMQHRVVQQEAEHLTAAQQVIQHSATSDSPLMNGCPSRESHQFFDSNNVEFRNLRNMLATLALDECLRWLKNGGVVAIHDATNSNIARRKELLDHIRAVDANIDVLFVESICNKDSVLSRNIELKLNGPDYVDVRREDARQDFLMRIKNYESYYFHVSPEECTANVGYIKLFDAGDRVEAHNVRGHIMRMCKTLLSSIHVHPKVIYIVHSPATCSDEKGRCRDSYMRKFAEGYAEFLSRDIRNKEASPYESHNALMGQSVNSAIEVWIPPLAAAMESAKVVLQTFPSARIRCMMSLFSPEPVPTNQEPTVTNQNLPPTDLPYIQEVSSSTVNTRGALNNVIIELELTKHDVVIIAGTKVLREIFSYFCGDSSSYFLSQYPNEHCLYSIVPGPYYSSVSKYKYVMESLRFEEVFCQIKT